MRCLDYLGIKREVVMRLDTFGKRLKVLRIDRGLSQIELRDAMKKHGVDIGETYISELERSAKMPMLDVAAAMAQALGVTVDYLALIVEEALPLERAEPEPHYMTPEADEVARLVDDMSKDQRGLVVELARSLMLPPQTRQQRRSIALEILELVERKFGLVARQEIEKRVQGDNSLSAAPK